ncbi:DUF6922 domain-containing protein [Chryseobacterium echinoideorum]|uniref:DUF6922 domain-containing protein n=1 Tax=Chryseobacterium echinoideorum TaxID=1549648 RepID=UPI0011855ED4
MKQKVNIASIFPKYLFWDMDYSKLNSETDKDIIIPRAMYATTLESFENDILKLESIYSKKDILNHLKNTKELISNEVCTMVSQRYNVASFSRFKKV